MVMKKIKLTESDLYNIIKQVLLEQEEQEKRTVTFDSEKFTMLVTSSEKIVKHFNNKYDKVIINGHLNLIGTPIQSLPDNLRVEGWLDLYGCKNFKSLGDNLYVKGILDLRGTPIQSLPDNLRVGGHLFLGGTPIQSLPDNLHVTKIIFIKGTPLNKNDELVKKY